jgi:SAM-dependent methyltransferase
MELKNDQELAMSPVVANCRMNRERQLCGGNSYEQDLGLNPLDFLNARLEDRQSVRWLDLCCGSGRALVEASQQLSDVEITGIDLVDMFVPGGSSNLQLIDCRLEDWRPPQQYDLITCVHGLHYVGDKLDVISKASSWLSADGLFVAHLDLNNFRHKGHSTFGRKVVQALRDAGLLYDSRRRITRCEGRTEITMPWHFRGSDDKAGPNFTGQPAVNSWYEDV